MKIQVEKLLQFVEKYAILKDEFIRIFFCAPPHRIFYRRRDIGEKT